MKNKQIPLPSYWLCHALVGKNKVQGRVLAKDRPQAIERMLRAAHSRYPKSLIVVMGGQCRRLT